eukprot:Rhum_TRINITY_DN14738_c9_g2::Rhum_TRINITY_DN14738_c9_g2_i1::g.110635::m.110635
MRVTACVSGQKVTAKVATKCRTLQELKEAIVVALPKLFDVSVGGRAIDDDEAVVSLDGDAILDVSVCGRAPDGDDGSISPDNSVRPGVSVCGRASDDDKKAVLSDKNVATNAHSVLVKTGRRVSEFELLHAAGGDATLLLDAGVPVDCVDASGETPLHRSCFFGHLETLPRPRQRCYHHEESQGRDTSSLRVPLWER